MTFVFLLIFFYWPCDSGSMLLLSAILMLITRHLILKKIWGKFWRRKDEKSVKGKKKSSGVGKPLSTGMREGRFHDPFPHLGSKLMLLTYDFFLPDLAISHPSPSRTSCFMTWFCYWDCGTSMIINGGMCYDIFILALQSHHRTVGHFYHHLPYV